LTYDKAKGLFGLRLSSPSHSRGGAKTVAAIFLAALLVGCGVENELRPCAHATARRKCSTQPNGCRKPETVARNVLLGATRCGHEPNTP